MGKINLRPRREFPKFSLFEKKRRERLRGYTTIKKNYLETRSFCYIIYEQQKPRSFSSNLPFVNTGKNSHCSGQFFKILSGLQVQYMYKEVVLKH